LNAGVVRNRRRLRGSREKNEKKGENPGKGGRKKAAGSPPLRSVARGRREEESGEKARGRKMSRVGVYSTAVLPAKKGKDRGEGGKRGSGIHTSSCRSFKKERKDRKGEERHAPCSISPKKKERGGKREGEKKRRRRFLSLLMLLLKREERGDGEKRSRGGDDCALLLSSPRGGKKKRNLGGEEGEKEVLFRPSTPS